MKTNGWLMSGAEYLQSGGYPVLRFCNEEVLDNIDRVLGTIARHLKSLTPFVRRCAPAR
jgi:very-short-patch-repair endonuclease